MGSRIEIVTGDMLTDADVRVAMKHIDVVYYLVHASGCYLVHASGAAGR